MLWGGGRWRRASPRRIWMTYKQAQELGGHVRKGEKGTLVVYAKTVTRTETDESTGEEQRAGYSVHEGLHRVQRRADRRAAAAVLSGSAAPRLDPVQRIERAEAFFAATGADHPAWRQHGLLQRQADDRVQMPPFEAFRDAESYYATLAHELTHWTRHPSPP